MCFIENPVVYLELVPLLLVKSNPVLPSVDVRDIHLPSLSSSGSVSWLASSSSALCKEDTLPVVRVASVTQSVRGLCAAGVDKDLPVPSISQRCAKVQLHHRWTLQQQIRPQVL